MKNWPRLFLLLSIFAARLVELTTAGKQVQLTTMKEDVGWPTLETRRKYVRLVMFKEFPTNKINMKLPSYVM